MQMRVRDPLKALAPQTFILPDLHFSFGTVMVTQSFGPLRAPDEGSPGLVCVETVEAVTEISKAAEPITLTMRNMR
jgi:hypothetical protein